ncbi:MAG: error-prone DNA polymerase [Alphaproteobacteria bacterium]|nr:error-prone DNA polymerase [Alphaproteobacteria bacterium]
MSDVTKSLPHLRTRRPPTPALPRKGGGGRVKEDFSSGPSPLAGEGRVGGGVAYAELQVTSNFSFLRGASRPEELVLAAAALGHTAIAITDHNTVAGIVRAHAAAKEVGIRLVIGARLDFEDGPSVLCFPRDRAAYGRMTSLLTVGKRRAEKGQCKLFLADLVAHAEGQVLVILPPERLDAHFEEQVRVLRTQAGAGYLAAHHLYRGRDARSVLKLGAFADAHGLGLVATNDVHYHAAERRPLQDVLTCIRAGCTIHDAGLRLFANAERHLKPPDEMAQLFRARPDALARTTEIVDSCAFALDDIKYEYPAEPVPDGLTPQQYLEQLTWQGAQHRYPHGIPEPVRAQIEKEFALIAHCKYAPYFLTVYDIVRFARDDSDGKKPILCQGRGSAANSAVCFALGITEVDPAHNELLFERFVSAERQEPPDIDVDFEHERREEVIQYIYRKYGRARAGLAATVISYRPRSALRDVGKAMGLSLDTVDVLSRIAWSWEREEGGVEPHHLREVGLDPDDVTIRRTLKLANELLGFPRHLSQHVGGFVITRSPLHELVPIENAAMEDRTVIEWDKDDLDEVGMFKIDVLALGMLSCIRRGFDLLREFHGENWTIAAIPQDDRPTYEMISRADTIGVFQVESRAQMSMLPRLRPQVFYDLVIEVAIVRPGPIQGGMVHPYLKRREALRDRGIQPEYPSPELEQVLKRTLGVPLFQEQAMQIAIVGAGFPPAKADKLRRAMATFRRMGTIHQFTRDFVEGMVARGYARDFAERCFLQIKGFGEYGFPESHAASFALLVYVSAWMKCHHPAVFAAALLNSQPMGFYAPAQIVRDAREHGVEVRPVDVSHSDWDCTLEPSGTGERTAGGEAALRLGFRQVKGFREDDAKALVESRGGGYASVREVWRRAGLTPAALETLANADAWRSLGLDRRAALWEIRGLGAAPLPLFAHAEQQSAGRVPALGHNLPPAVESAREPQVALPEMPLGVQVVEDYRHLRMTLKTHPLALLRSSFARRGVVQNRQLAQLADGDRVTVAGLVLIRQQPGTAKGVIFVTLEDETGIANAVLWPDVSQAHRRPLLDSRLLLIRGKLQSYSNVIHVVAETLVDCTSELRRLADEDAKFEAGAEFASGARGDDLNKTWRPDSRDPRAVFPEGRSFH